MHLLRFTLLLGLILITSNQLVAQQADDIRYYDVNLIETGPDKAYYIKSYFFAPDNKNEGKIITKKTGGQLVSDIDFGDISKGQKHGIALYYDSLGNISAKEIYHWGKKHGPLESFYPNGQRRRYDIYENDELISGQCFSTTGADTPYYVYQQMPSFPGGDAMLLAFMAKHTKYPPYARENSITGIVIIGFVVNSSGKIEQIQLRKSIDESLDGEAMRVVKLMQKKVRWSPGIAEGEKVNVQYNLPFRFSLR